MRHTDEPMVLRNMGITTLIRGWRSPVPNPVPHQYYFVTSIKISRNIRKVESMAKWYWWGYGLVHEIGTGDLYPL